jgi:hypothetical protein
MKTSNKIVLQLIAAACTLTAINAHSATFLAKRKSPIESTGNVTSINSGIKSSVSAPISISTLPTQVIVSPVTPPTSIVNVTPVSATALGSASSRSPGDSFSFSSTGGAFATSSSSSNSSGTGASASSSSSSCVGC